MFFLGKCLRGLGSICAVGLALSAVASEMPPKAHPAVDKVQAKRKLTKQNQRFIENAGQWDSKGRFFARSGSMDVWVTGDGLTFNVHTSGNKPTKSGMVGQVVGLKMLGANASASLQGYGAKSITTEYLKANDKKYTAKSFEGVLDKNVYDGIDLKTYFDGNQPRYDFVVAPHADPSKIRLAFRGADKVRLKNNAIVVDTHVGELIQGKLFAYQMQGSAKKQVSAQFKLDADGTVALNLGSYDHSKTLVIDPLIYGSYYGGDNGMDEVEGVTSDSTGGTYLTGWTFATRFPVIYGPYGINYPGMTQFRQAFLSKIQGDAYSHDYAAYLSGTLDNFGQFVQVDQFGNVWVAGRTQSSDFPGSTRHNIQFLKGDKNATGGTWILQYQDQFKKDQWVFPYNATPAEVQAAVEATPAYTGKITITAFSGSTLNKGAVYKFEAATDLAGGWATVSTRVGNQNTETSEGLPAQILLFNVTNTLQVNGPKQFQFVRRGSVPDPNAALTVTFTNTGAGTTATTTVLSPYDSAATYQAAFQALGNIGAGNIAVANGPVAFTPMFALIPMNAAPAGTMAVTNIFMGPNVAYNFEAKQTDIFLLRFARTSSGGLDPLIDKKTHSLLWGGLDDEHLAGFSIVPKSVATNPVQMVFAGWKTPTKLAGDDLGTDMPIPTPAGTVGFVARYNYTTSFSQIKAASQFITSSAFPIVVSGVTTDKEGSTYVAGTIYGKGNTNLNSASTIFATYSGATNSVYSVDNARGDLLRGNDIWVRKYKATGSKGYSVVIGGNGDDFAGGIVSNTQGQNINTGTCVAVDDNLNAYVTGVSGGFNFPRTRGVYGETFGPDRVVTVTKLNADASALIYSTNLKTTGNVTPAGIAVDTRGFAFVTMLLGVAGQVTFPIPPSDPNEPSAFTFPSIPITPDALDPVYDSPAVKELPTTEGALFVLNDTATTDVYSTYIGGLLDEFIYAPYVDKFGDVWVFGSTDSARDYIRVSSTGTVTEYLRLPGGAELPSSLISSLAFKKGGDAGGGGFTNLNGVLYGALESPFTSPQTIRVGVMKDGFLIKQRIAQATVASVTVAPSTAPGGGGTTITGTVTLSQGAPASGADIVLTLDSTAAASFDSAAPLASTTISIAAGVTTGTFTVYTSPVLANTNVQVKANYQGSFKIAQFVVVPWLQQLSITPTSVVGGNGLTGKITLSSPAPAGGMQVDLKSDIPALIFFPGGNTITVPAGQTTMPFNISTNGVAVQTVGNVTATVLGLGKSQAITLTLASLKSLTFAPPRVAGGASSTGTILLDGAAGAPFTVNLTLSAGTAGYSIPSTVTFDSGASSASFTLQTAYEALNTNRTVTVFRPKTGNYVAQTITGKIFVDNLDLVIFTVSLDDPADFAAGVLSAGNKATGSLTVNTTAPAGGVAVAITLQNGLLVAPAVVTIPAGTTTTSFEISAPVSASSGTCDITASRGAISITRTITVAGVGLGLDLPSSIVGGLSTTGTITLTKEVGANDIVVTLTVTPSGGHLSVPASVTFAGGSTVTTKTFTITTTALLASETAPISYTITATSGTQTTSKQILVTPVGIAGVRFAKSPIVNLKSTTLSVTIDAPAPAGGVTIPLTWSSTVGLAVGYPTSVRIEEGQTSSAAYTVSTTRVSRSISTTVSATYLSSSSSATLVITQY